MIEGVSTPIVVDKLARKTMKIDRDKRTSDTRRLTYAIKVTRIIDLTMQQQWASPISYMSLAGIRTGLAWYINPRIHSRKRLLSQYTIAYYHFFISLPIFKRLLAY